MSQNRHTSTTCNMSTRDDCLLKHWRMPCPQSEKDENAVVQEFEINMLINTSLTRSLKLRFTSSVTPKNFILFDSAIVDSAFSTVDARERLLAR